MRVQQFLEHHGIAQNPFAEEDAQTDPVFKDHCIDSTYHPTWDKVYGNPAEPATSLVFGEKGAGKTAMRLQIVQHLNQYNQTHPGDRIFVIQYDDFNPFLDRFVDRLSPRKRQATRALKEWKLWDHMDSILSLGVTALIDRLLKVKYPTGPITNEVGDAEVRLLDRHQARDLLILASCYDQSTAETFQSRWKHLRRKLRFSTWKNNWDKFLGCAVAISVLSLIVWQRQWSWLSSFWPYLIVALGWAPWTFRAIKWWRRAWHIVRQVRTGNREINPLRRVLMQFSASDISSQPLPDRPRTDDRYELLMKLQGILRTLGFSGIIVLVDRVDEPSLITGSVEQMKAMLWPMLDNKFLKHPGLGFKLLLPIELANYLEREDRDFYQRARLDKQNLIPSLEWTGEALYDVAAARVKACSLDDKTPILRDLFDESVTEHRLIDAVRQLRVPRHLFKFLHRLIVTHCNAHTDVEPVWNISREMFESTLAVFCRDQDAVDRGFRAG